MKKPSFAAIATFALSLVVIMSSLFGVMSDRYWGSYVNQLPDSVDVYEHAKEIVLIQTIENWGCNVCYCVLALAVCYVAWSSRLMKCVYSIKGHLGVDSGDFPLNAQEIFDFVSVKLKEQEKDGTYLKANSYKTLSSCVIICISPSRPGVIASDCGKAMDEISKKAREKFKTDVMLFLESFG